MFVNSAMPLSIVAIFLLCGVCSTIVLPYLSNQFYTYLALALSIALISVRKHLSPIFTIACIALFGFGYMSFHVNKHLQNSFPDILEGKKVLLKGSICSVVEETKNQSVKFLFKVSNFYDSDQQWKLPAYIQLTWSNVKHNLQPGDSLVLRVKLKKPRNYANPGSFDSERYFFQQRIVATGYVVPSAENRLLTQSPLSQPINFLRQYLNIKVDKYLAGHEFAPIIKSLTLGVRSGMQEKHNEILQNTGTAHLLAISGLHIGLLASMCFGLIRFAWRYAPKSWLNLPSPLISATGAIILSFVYACLAGLSIATQRALIMLSIFLAAIILKRRICTWHSFYLALLLVLLWDPFVVLSIGFWLSFLAVGLLIYALRGQNRSQGYLAKLFAWFRPQVVIAIGLLPITLLSFSKSSIIGPVANCIAIPWVTFAVLPVGILAVLLLPFMPNVSAILLQLAANNFAKLWVILTKLSAVPIYVWQIPTEYIWLLIISSTLGVLWLFIPRGLPGRLWGVCGLVPLLFMQTPAIPFGQAEFNLLDVGQGLSIVIRTQNHTFIYDTGPKLPGGFDLGSNVVVPYLQSIGVNKIDTLMISHVDNDHIGGALAILNKIFTSDILISTNNALVEFNRKICVAGQTWNWDGVEFTVLHPPKDNALKKRNDLSCVLMVQAGVHKVLLTGDIEAHSEKQLIQSYGTQLQSDLLLVPHHGSKSSSSTEFLQIVKPKYALIPVGYKNQYGHPKESVLQRYRDIGATILRTEQEGAISFRLGGDLLPYCYRREQRRFWSFT